MGRHSAMAAMIAMALGASGGFTVDDARERAAKNEGARDPEPTPPTDPIRETRQMRRARERRERKSQ